jgi:lipopolysaccharide/colanic/teichoic acid biosynthesis glycosyltransferase
MLDPPGFLSPEKATASLAVEKRSVFAHRRVQILGLLVMPFVFWYLASLISTSIIPFNLQSVALEITKNTLGYSMIASLLGYIVLRQMIAHPGKQSVAFVLPSLVVSFGLVCIFLFLARIDYSRAILGTSFMASNFWLVVMTYLDALHIKPKFALIPKGNHRGIRNVSVAEWMLLESPSQVLPNIDGVVADLHADLPEKWERYISRCILNGIPVYDVKNIAETLTGRVEIEHLSENSFGAVLPSKLYLRVKRSIDLVFALVLLPFFAIIIFVAGIAIKLDSKGPIFFIQQRTGYRGGKFNIYKLRSMKIDSEPGKLFTGDNDQRITKTGSFIRKYRIDEMPQILNIVKGEMSWIGPRPEAAEMAEWYAKEISFYAYRHAVRPGLSGWAQVNQGNVAEIDAVTIKLQYDFYYTKYFSPWLDFLIVIKTVTTVLSGFGSK